MTENEISYKIRGAIYNVYNHLGPGLLESVYEHILAYELILSGLEIATQVPIPVIYNNVKVDIGFRADVIVNRKVIIEIKSVEILNPVHHKQLLTYLKLTKIKLGILVNFNTDNIETAIHRKIK